MTGSAERQDSRRAFLRAAGASLGAALLPAQPASADRPSARAYISPAESERAIDDAVTLAIKSIALDGFDNFLPGIVEARQLGADENLRRAVFSSVKRWLTSGGEDGEAPHGLVCYPVPKTKPNAFRIGSLLDPVDAVRYLSVAILVAQKVETRRLPQGSGRVLSYRFSPSDGVLFDPAYDLGRFRHHVNVQLAALGGAHVVLCDIADFYASIRAERLLHVLRAEGVDEWITAALGRLLMRWETESGLAVPTGPRASNILGEVALIGSDRDLEALGVNFVRFVDDYRLLAPDRKTADKWRNAVAARLASDGFLINADKTSIVRASAAGLRSEVAQIAPQATDPSSPATSLDEPTTDPGLNDFYSGGPRRPYEGGPRRSGELGPRFDGLAKVDPGALLMRLKTQASILPKYFRVYLEAGRHHGRTAECAIEAMDLLDRCPANYMYFGDFLLQEARSIPPSQRSDIAAAFGQRLMSNRFDAFNAVAVVSVLGSRSYRNYEAVHAYLEGHAGPLPSILGSALLNVVSSRTTPEQALQLFAKYGRTDGWTRRAAVRLLRKHFARSEYETLMGAELKTALEDPFMVAALEQQLDPPRVASR